MGRSKLDILIERLERARNEAQELEKEIRGLDFTPFGHPCTYCGEMLHTEADFAGHFIVSRFNEMNNLLNLGDCPKDTRRV